MIILNINDHIRDLHYNWRFYIDIGIKRGAMNGLVESKIKDPIDKSLVKQLIETNDTSNISLELFSRLPHLHVLVENRISDGYTKEIKNQKVAALNLFHDAESKMDIVDCILEQSRVVPTYFNKDWMFYINTDERKSYIYQFFEDDLFGSHTEKDYLKGKTFNLVDGLVYYYSAGGEI